MSMSTLIIKYCTAGLPSIAPQVPDAADCTILTHNILTKAFHLLLLLCLLRLDAMRLAVVVYSQSDVELDQLFLILSQHPLFASINFN